MLACPVRNEGDYTMMILKDNQLEQGWRALELHEHVHVTAPSLLPAHG